MRSSYIQLGKKQQNLGPDKDAAKEEYGRLIAGRQPVDEDTPEVTNFVLTSQLMRRARSRHDAQILRRHLHSFGKLIGDTLMVEKLTPDHVSD